jgi:hypothetical protein
MYIYIYINIYIYIYIYVYTYTGPPPIKEEALFDGDMQLPENVLTTIQYTLTLTDTNTRIYT